jgi:hypothetical protein
MEKSITHLDVVLQIGSKRGIGYGIRPKKMRRTQALLGVLRVSNVETINVILQEIIFHKFIASHLVESKYLI